jgi:hypothetical protein
MNRNAIILIVFGALAGCSGGNSSADSSAKAADELRGCATGAWLHATHACACPIVPRGP